jgi:hypothetical protein
MGGACSTHGKNGMHAEEVQEDVHPVFCKLYFLLMLPAYASRLKHGHANINFMFLRTYNSSSSGWWWWWWWEGGNTSPVRQYLDQECLKVICENVSFVLDIAAGNAECCL